MAFFHSPNIVTDGLVLCLDPADQACITSGSTTATDLSPSTNNGTLNDAKVGKDAAGSATAAVSSSGVFHLDGTDYITVTDTADLTFGTGEFAIEMWLKFTDFTPGGDDWVTAWQHSSAEHARSGVFLFYAGGSPDLDWRMECNWGDIGGGTVYPAIIDLDSYISLNKWHYFTVSRQAEAVLKQYIDGVLIQTTTTADGATGPRDTTWETTWPDIGGTLLIGNYRTADNHEFQGEIGPVRCYKGNSLSDGEVLQNFNAQRSRFGV